MNWYAFIKISALEDFLNNLGVSEDVKQFLLGLPREQIQYYVNFLKDNPNVTLEQLKENVEFPESKDPYLQVEKNIVNNAIYGINNVLNVDQLSKWLLVQLRKARANVPMSKLVELDTPTSDSLDFVDIMPDQWQNIVAFIEGNSEFSQLIDWYAYENPNLNNFNFYEALNAANQWHEQMAEEGAGKEYEENNVIYGPEWEFDDKLEEDWTGWTIQEVRSENDLLAEGYKMNHCVGSYCEDVKEENLRVFSLRDPSNNPHVTISMSPDGNTIDEIRGNSNNEPKDEYKNLISEWFSTFDNPPIWQKERNTVAPRNAEGFFEVIDNFYSFDEYGVATLPDEYTVKSDSDNNYIVDWSDYNHDLMKSLMSRDVDYSVKYDGDVTQIPKRAVDLAYEQGEDSLVDLLEDARNRLTDYQEKADEVFDEMYVAPDPDAFNVSPEDFESEEEYQQEYEKILDREKDRALEEFIKTWLPTGYFLDIFNSYNKLAKRKKLPSAKEILDKKDKERFRQIYGNII